MGGGRGCARCAAEAASSAFRSVIQQTSTEVYSGPGGWAPRSCGLHRKVGRMRSISKAQPTARHSRICSPLSTYCVLSPRQSPFCLMGETGSPRKPERRDRQSIKLANNHGACAMVLEFSHVMFITTLNGTAVPISVTPDGKRGPRLCHEDHPGFRIAHIQGEGARTDMHQRHIPGTGDTTVKKIKQNLYSVLVKAGGLGLSPSSATYQLCDLGQVT